MQHRNELGKLLNDHQLVGTGVEVGVWRGEFAEIILDKWRGQKLIGVDIWEDPKPMQQARERLGRFKQRWDPRQGDSVKLSKMFLDHSMDFVYIDADHTYDSCKRDLESWFHKVKPGGLFCGHDYWNGIRNPRTKTRVTIEYPTRKELKKMNFGVKAAVDEFVQANKLPLPRSTKEWPTTWWLFVPG